MKYNIIKAQGGLKLIKTAEKALPVIKRIMKRTSPEKYIYGGEKATHDGYIIENENVGEFLNKLHGKDIGNGYIAVHADPSTEKTMLSATDRDALVEQLAKLPSGSIISSYSKSPQGMLSYGVLAKQHPEKFELVQFENETLPDFDYEYFPWNKWKEGMTTEEKLNVLNKRRTGLGLPEGTINANGEMRFPWVALRRLNKGGKIK